MKCAALDATDNERAVVAKYGITNRRRSSVRTNPVFDDCSMYCIHRSADDFVRRRGDAAVMYAGHVGSWLPSGVRLGDMPRVIS